MIWLRFENECRPKYMTSMSAGCDLIAREALTLEPQQRGKVATGTWIDKVDLEECPKGMIPELQVRCRSGLAFKHGIMLTNGVGTIDIDYEDEFCVLLYNSGTDTFHIKPGDRVAQLVLSMTGSIANIERGEKRHGGFGSTGSR